MVSVQEGPQIIESQCHRVVMAERSFAEKQLLDAGLPT